MLIHFLYRFGLQKWLTNVYGRQTSFTPTELFHKKRENCIIDVVRSSLKRMLGLLALKEQGRIEAGVFIAAVTESSLFCTECQYKLIYDVPNFNKDKL